MPDVKPEKDPANFDFAKEQQDAEKAANDARSKLLDPLRKGVKQNRWPEPVVRNAPSPNSIMPDRTGIGDPNGGTGRVVPGAKPLPQRPDAKPALQLPANPAPVRAAAPGNAVQRLFNEAPAAGVKPPPQGKVPPLPNPAALPAAPKDANDAENFEPAAQPPMAPGARLGNGAEAMAEDQEKQTRQNMHLLQSWYDRVTRNKSRNPNEIRDLRNLDAMTKKALAAREAYMANPKDPVTARNYHMSQNAYRSLAQHAIKKYVTPHIGEGGVRRHDQRGNAVSVGGKPAYDQFGPDHEVLDQETLSTLMELMGHGGHQVPMPVRKQRQGLPVRYQSSYLMVSSNVRDSDKTRNTAHYKDPMNFNSALNATTSGRHQTGADNAANLIHSITQVKPIVQHGVGDWADGGENTTVHELPGAVPHEKLRKAAANVGLTHAQKSVLIFTPHDDGTHLFHTVQVPKMHPEMLRKSLDEHGVAFRTIVPGKTHDTLHVYDGDGGTIKNLQRWSQQHGAKMQTQRGTGEFIADLYDAKKDYTPGRMASKKVYMDIDPTLRPGSDRPYETRQVFTQKNFTRSRVRYAAEHAQHDARRLAGGDVSAGSMEVMQRYLTDLSKHDPDKLSKMLDTNQVGDRGKHYEWLDSLGESTRAMLQHLAGQKPDIGGGAPGGKQMPSSIAKLAKSILTNPDSYRRNLRDLHHQLIDAGLYGSGSKPVWPDKERLLEVAGKLKGTGRIGELDQYLQSVHKNHPMVDLEESQSPAPAEQKQEQQHPCHNCSGGMQEQVARLEARGMKLRFEGDMRHMERGQKAAECE
jgi:hypothetical protein